MKLKVGDAIAWKVKDSKALRVGQYLGNHAYRLKSEKKSTKDIDEKIIRVWPTRVTMSTRKIQTAVKEGSLPFVLLSTDEVVKIP